MEKVINEFSGNEIILKNKYREGSSITTIPIDIKLDDEIHTIFNEPLPETMPGPTHQKPGLWETFKGRFAEQEELIQTNEWMNRKTSDANPIDDYVDPNWSPVEDKSVLIGVDKRNVGYILEATGPKDQRRRYNYVLDKQEHDERLSRGNLIMQMAGGFSGFAASPSSLIPIAKAVKYGKLSQTFLQNIPKMIGGIAVASASHEAVLETTKIGGNMADWAINTMVDTLIGTAFMGAHLSLSSGADAWKLFNARGIMKMVNDGIVVKPILDNKGVVKSIKASPMDNSVGAAEVDIAQVYLDAALSKNSLHYIPYIGDTIGSSLGSATSYIGGIFSPKIRMLGSKFSTVRGLANNFAEHSLKLKE